MTTVQTEMFDKDKEQAPIRIFTDGAGARPDGKGSGYAFLRPDTGDRQIIREDGLTNNQAEYKAIILALETLPKATAVQICTDSQVACEQLNGRYKVLEPKLVQLRNSITEVIRRKSLNATFDWVPRAENMAGKLL